MRLPKLPKELDPRRRFRRKKTSDAPEEPRAYGQHVDLNSEQDEMREFERTTGEVVREGDEAAEVVTATPSGDQKAVHEIEEFEDLTDEPVRER